MMESWKGLCLIVTTFIKDGNICSSLWLVLWFTRNNELTSKYSCCVLLAIELILLVKCSDIFAIKLTTFSEHNHTFSLEEPIYLPRFAPSLYLQKFWVTSIHDVNSLNTLLNISRFSSSCLQRRMSISTETVFNFRVDWVTTLRLLNYLFALLCKSLYREILGWGQKSVCSIIYINISLNNEWYLKRPLTNNSGCYAWDRRIRQCKRRTQRSKVDLDLFHRLWKFDKSVTLW